MTCAVVLVNNSRRFGGAELYLEQLMRARPPGATFTLVTRDSAPRRLIEAAVGAGVPVTLWRPDPAGLRRLSGHMRKADVVHLNMAWSGDHAHAVALAWLCRRPVVATVHIWVHPRSSLRRWLMSVGYRRFQRVIAVSAEIRDLLLSELRVAPDAVTVVANGVPYADPVRRPPAPAVVLGGLGRLEPAKGFDLLIEAVRRLRARGCKVEAVIAGEGAERERLEGAARGLPVRFAGFVTDTRTFLAGVDVFCLPSRWEGLPFALLEAMMAGIACVGADVGDVAEAMGEAGRVIPPEDVDALTAALEELASSPRLREELGGAAHQRARDHYSLEASVTKTIGVYEEAQAVMRQGGRTPRAVAGRGPGGRVASRRRPDR